MFIYVNSGWVQTVLLYKSSSKHHFILKAYVKASQKLTDAPYNAWVCVDGSGNTITAHCTCMAG